MQFNMEYLVALQNLYDIKRNNALINHLHKIVNHFRNQFTQKSSDTYCYLILVDTGARKVTDKFLKCQCQRLISANVI